MTMPSVVLGSPQWMIPAVILIGMGVVGISWNVLRWRGRRGMAVLSAVLKLIALTGLALCLVEPLLTGSRAQPGANVFVVLADTSQSLQVRDGDTERTRADWARGLLEGEQPWLTRLSQDFDTRRFVFDTHLRPVDGFQALAFDGTASSLHAALHSVAQRYQGRPIAGILLISDGNATDTVVSDGPALPPVFPVLPPTAPVAKDLAVSHVTVNQTNFEAAPVALQVKAEAHGFRNQPIVLTVTDEAGKEVARQSLTPTADTETLSHRFQLRPERAGIGFFRVNVRATDEAIAEQTLANNSRQVVVDRGGGPYRVLYVCGRPNWEFKYLRRAIAEDADVQLVGLVRVARREAKFDFRGTRAQPNSPLFKGFDHPDADTAERRDQPVLVRLNTEDGVELRGGFPVSAADMYRYHALILDDIEADFFTPEQQLLVRNFVARRGGGFLMLGGPDTFGSGKYDRTPIGDLLPVYLDGPANPSGEGYRFALTREGWLQPWVRTRKSEDEENARLNGMAPFQSVSMVGRAKPGASVLAQVLDATGQTLPALVAQPFGKGRSAALTIGDLWRWQLRREDHRQDDFERAWRQTVRWLVADVPGKVELRASSVVGTNSPTIDLTVRAADADFLPLDNATVVVRILRPSREELKLTAEPDSKEAGAYGVKFVAREPGAYTAVATVLAPDGSAVGRHEVGWCVQPEADEFARSEPNRVLLESLATRTNGQVIPAEDLAGFVADLSFRTAPVMETWVSPIWHRASYFLLAILCLIAEWGLRRRHGMA
jgi:hypothetical protein